jgi:hypothetical protein
MGFGIHVRDVIMVDPVVISLNDFLAENVKSCFCCKSKKYEEFFFLGRLYRVCDVCIKKKNVRKFFNSTIPGMIV